MKLIKIDDNVAINIDRIDGIVKDTKDPDYARIYVGGDSDPFVVDCTVDEVIERISRITESENKK